jgi:hypothetical protein
VRAAAAASTLLVALVACGDDPAGPRIPTRGGPLFLNYVALGGSTAAGQQSLGLSAATQIQAYPIELAQRADAGFQTPLVAGPGCPPPITVAMTLPDVPPGCNLQSTIPLEGGENISVPGVTVAQMVTVPTGPVGALNTLLIGSRTQLSAMQTAQPTLVTVHAGDHDVLAAALSGVLGPAPGGGDSTLTTLAAFQAGYTQIVNAVKSVSTLQGAVLIGVLNPVTGVPALQPGGYFFLSRNAGGQFNGKPVNNNCSPVTALGQPNPLSANLVSFTAVTDPAVVEINCDPAATAQYLLEASDQAAVTARVTAMNAAIQAHATANNWVFIDPNAIGLPNLTEQDGQGRFQKVRKCQALAAATTPAQFQAAVLNSCPGNTAIAFFGSLYSLDGMTPSLAGHTFLANEIAKAINTRYSTTLTVN